MGVRSPDTSSLCVGGGPLFGPATSQDSEAAESNHASTFGPLRSSVLVHHAHRGSANHTVGYRFRSAVTSLDVDIPRYKSQESQDDECYAL